MSVISPTNFEPLTNAYFRLNQAWEFVDFNEATAKLLAKSESDLMNQCIWRVFPQLQQSVFAQEYHRVVQQQVSSHLEAFCLPLRLWVEAFIWPCGDGIVVEMRDISDRKRLEADLLTRSCLSELETHISHIFQHDKSLSQSLSHCTEALIQDLDLAAASVWMRSPQSSHLQLQALSLSEAYEKEGHLSSYAVSPHLDDPDQNVLQAQPFCLEKALLDWMVENRQPIQDFILPADLNSKCQPLNGNLATSPFDDSLFCDLTPALLRPCRTIHFIAYPLCMEAEFLGAIALWSYQSPTPATQSTFSTLANTIALAVDRDRLKTALQSRQDNLLFRLANQIRKSLDLNTILETAVQEIRTLLNVDRCHYLWSWSHPSQPSLTVSHEASSDAQNTSLIGDCPPQKLILLANLINNLQSLQIDRVATAKQQTALPYNRDILQLLDELQITSFFMLPLQTRSGHLGAIACSSSHGEHPWSDREVELLQGVVDQLALAIDQAELFAQTRATALAAQTQAQQLQLALQELKRTQSQLIQTEKMSSLGQMIAGIAHEINNPMNFISGNLSYTSEYVNDVLELLKLYQESYPQPTKDIDDFTEEIDLDFILEDLPKTLASMQIGAERIQQIVLSLRNFSRLDQAEMKPVDIHEGIDSTLLILHNRIKAKSSRRELEIIKDYGNLPKVDCYAGQLNQVFMNLLSNSIDALEPQALDSEAPTPKIHIRTALLANDWVEIKIGDNGPGMTEKTINHIFDPFFTTKPVGKGTGLGLSISYQIVVEKHRGKISCTSGIGKGTEFSILIPAEPPPELKQT
ncbi:MAG: ATP-binding protein [Jaaginema sp. PMC 1079.18]|nr:ATP-binding protein [Jaaginema sp. PMC 1080.18]MEC4853188.1 ATP-binding protein [Jaaginema sp. PMC 1079.18]MEC4865883.1 ATP-binding protein [Jaaginema sp. PMC 1078.18]